MPQFGVDLFQRAGRFLYGDGSDDFNTAGQLTTASRSDPTAGTATTTVVYGVPLSGTGLPDVSQDSAGAPTWGETSDVPVTGTAIFPPSHTPAGQTASTISSTDWPWAVIDYLDLNGAQVNDASYGNAQWLVNTSQYDTNGNEIWSLSAGNRAIALGTQTTGDTTLTSTYATGAPRAAVLATQHLYSATDPSEEVQTLGPVHPITLPDGTRVEGQDETLTSYTTGSGTDPATSEIYSYDLPQTVTATVYEPSSPATSFAYPDSTTTTYGYAAVGSMAVTGYELNTPTTTTVQMGATPSSADLVTTDEYDSQGRHIAHSLPANTSGTGAQTQLTTYYTATGTGACVNAAWAGEVCQTSPAAQPSSGQALPVSTYTYDQLGDVTTQTQVSGSTTRTITDAYDAAGRITTSQEAISPEDGAPLPAVSYTYDPNGLTATTGYDENGQATSLAYTLGQATWMTFTATKGEGGQTVAQSSPGEQDAYAYDADGRLTQTQATTSSSGSSAQCTATSYTFDADSNRTSLTTSTPGATCANATTASMKTSSYDSADRITTTGYAYDGLGRTTTVPAADAQGAGGYAAATGNLALTYYDNDMAATETQGAWSMRYSLDPLQDRIAVATSSDGTTSSTTVNDYADNTDSPAWSTTAGTTTRDVTGPDGNLAATITGSGTVTLELPNLDGSIVATAADSTSDTGINSGSYTAFDAYGIPEQASSDTETYGWAGADQRSAESLGGLILMGARLYNPDTGRFLTTDPIYQGNANPYTYPSDPIDLMDVTGLLAWWQWGAIKAAIGVSQFLIGGWLCAVFPEGCPIVGIVVGALGGAISAAAIARVEGKPYRQVLVAAERGAMIGAVTGFMGKILTPLRRVLSSYVLPKLALYLWGHLR